jgi:hypothetical protein
MYLLTTRDKSTRNPQQLHAQLAGDRHGRHSLAGPAGSEEQRANAAAVGKLLAKLPPVIHLGRQAHMVDDFGELSLAVRGEHDVGDAEHRFDALCEVRQALDRQLPARRGESLERPFTVAVGRRRVLRQVHSLLKSVDRQGKTVGDLLGFVAGQVRAGVTGRPAHGRYAPRAGQRPSRLDFE